jgi:hypothetical protein
MKPLDPRCPQDPDWPYTDKQLDDIAAPYTADQFREIAKLLDPPAVDPPVPLADHPLVRRVVGIARAYKDQQGPASGDRQQRLADVDLAKKAVKAAGVLQGLIRCVEGSPEFHPALLTPGVRGEEQSLPAAEDKEGKGKLGPINLSGRVPHYSLPVKEHTVTDAVSHYRLKGSLPVKEYTVAAADLACERLMKMLRADDFKHIQQRLADFKHVKIRLPNFEVVESAPDLGRPPSTHALVAALMQLISIWDEARPKQRGRRPPGFSKFLAKALKPLGVKTGRRAFRDHLEKAKALLKK